ncbi:mediator of RNA polymerase II transcription subunit 4 isoform X2 [Lepeophtheirus salmonis]|uniref:mediator of RNA polymerase II transcription subunit 4 isoform X2 n=1 Tax=Lepeophtheirus salmonis TaxID=72036 RepID=UPI001AE25CA0|nr:mediator of RNA polymerase II transcription subunit 4-like isoform X2 [Lepeophtheirus salmonis]
MTSTRDKLIGLIDDMELLAGEMISNLIGGGKPKRLENEQIINLLKDKQKNLNETIELAEEQAEIEKGISVVNDQSTAIYQSRQKLEAINKANQNPVQSEDLIKYAHRISASNAVSAPLNWLQGDPRRPYPTDMEMRIGCLARPDMPPMTPNRGSDFHHLQSSPSSHPHTPQHHSVTPQHQHIGGGSAPGTPMSGMLNSPKMVPPGPHSMGGAPGFSWQGGEMTLNMRDGTSMHVETRGSHDRGGDDVEAMSTDSSSSSSTDSN